MGQFQPKIVECMKHYSKNQLVKDIFAGILVAVIAFPLSVALAISSGLSPEKGLYRRHHSCDSHDRLYHCG